MSQTTLIFDRLYHPFIVITGMVYGIAIPTLFNNEANRWITTTIRSTIFIGTGRHPNDAWHSWRYWSSRKTDRSGFTFEFVMDLLCPRHHLPKLSGSMFNFHYLSAYTGTDIYRYSMMWPITASQQEGFYWFRNGRRTVRDCISNSTVWIS